VLDGISEATKVSFHTFLNQQDDGERVESELEELKTREYLKPCDVVDCRIGVTTKNLVESPAKLGDTASVIIEHHYFCYEVG
jgi:hypothetical protein